MARKSRRQAAGAKAGAVKTRYRAAGYVRLSREEAEAGGSLHNQRAILEEYAGMQNDMTLLHIWEDNGSSGTNFCRSGFKGLLADVENEGINCILVKDLSRFGRNYLETGFYLEKYFPAMNVRFVAVCDRYDSLNKADNDSMTAFRNLLNEKFASDISMKVKKAKRIRMVDGAYMGTLPPYGYRKSGCMLMPDPVTAPIVHRIYREYSQGKTLTEIVGGLESSGILPPARYFYEEGLLHKENYAQCTRWRSSTLRRILSGEVYLGHTVQGKYCSAKIRDRNHTPVPHSDWIIVKDTHEGIITQEEFCAVSLRLKTGRKGGN